MPFLPSMGVTVTTWPSTLEESWPEFSSPSNAAFTSGSRPEMLPGVEPLAFGKASHLGDGDQQAASVVDHEEGALVGRVVAEARGGRRGPVGPADSGVIGEAHEPLSYRFGIRRILPQGFLQSRRDFVPEVLHHQPRQKGEFRKATRAPARINSSASSVTAATSV